MKVAANETRVISCYQVGVIFSEWTTWPRDRQTKPTTTMRKAN